ncbi:MAG: tyrosine-type recombinase/integrase [Thiovulaceae bacterium]|nr:tyrosine-type recombinase/integrase [Sulfurimonadaceae bacterium]
MYFNLKNRRTAGLTYKDDGQIPLSKIKDDKIVNTNITFTMPYKIQVRASKVLNGKRSINKETMTFNQNTTLLDAIKDASKRYEELMDELNNDIYKSKASDVIKPDMTFENAWFLIRNKEAKNGKDNSIECQFYRNWLQPIYNKALNKIAPNDIRDIAHTLKRANRSDRTQRRTYQVVNYIYSEINKSTTEFVLISPASMKGLPPLRNKTNLDLTLEKSKAVAQALRDYPVSPYREIFMWLLHGRRRGEVLSLKWEDINLEDRIYTIKEISNKAGINMTYKLSNRLYATLEVLVDINKIDKMKGFVFRSPDNKKALSEATLRNHWERVRNDNNFSFTRMHDLRKLLSEYLMNQMLQSDNIVDTALGHIPSGIASRYATMKNTTVGPIVDVALDGLLDENKAIEINNEKLKQLQIMFPEKSLEQLSLFLIGQ